MDRQPQALRDEPSGRRFHLALGAVLLGGALLRVAYLIAQPAHDPWYSNPIKDGAYYLAWARELVARGPGPEGAFYLAPLYPYTLALFVAIFGERLWLLYAVQHGLCLAAAAVIAIGWRRRSGPLAALSAAALFLSYPALLFFASTPLSETLAIFLLVLALALVPRDSTSSGLFSGLLVGAAAVARPNLLLVPVVWGLGELAAGRRRRAGLLAVGVMLALLPSTLRNLATSGHFVPVSSNAGITAYHGNGPGAPGIYTAPAGFLTGAGLEEQRRSAWLHARELSGLDLDPVEADRWWGRQAIAVRWREGLGTLRLLAARVGLTLDDYELDLAYGPALDSNPWLPILRIGEDLRIPLISFGLLLGLTVVGWRLRDPGHAPGWWTWSALLACAATPVLFYVSSRYRLPFAALLAIPAGSGVAALVAIRPRRRLVPALFLGAVVALGSWSSWAGVTGDLRRLSRAGQFAKRSAMLAKLGALEAAERDALRAVELADLAETRLAYGIVLDRTGRVAQAEAEYRRAVAPAARGPATAAAAELLAKLLIDRGDHLEAARVALRALIDFPRHAGCRETLIISLWSSGDRAAARWWVEQSRRMEIVLDPEVLRLAEASDGRR